MTEQINIPGSIVKAICAVMSTMESVKKSQKNQHGGWMYSSTDDIYAAVAAKMGQVGLICLAQEGELEIIQREGKEKATVPWLRAVYYFVLATETDTFHHPHFKRTVMVRIDGPQTFQAAQSYVEKAFLRSLFKIPTGDMDLDSLPENFEYASVLSKSPPPIPTADQKPVDPVIDRLARALVNASPSTVNQVWNGMLDEMKDEFGDDQGRWDTANRLFDITVKKLGVS